MRVTGGDDSASRQSEKSLAKAGIEVLAFDLDGTLVDSVPDLNHCLGETAKSFGLRAPTDAETRTWVGDGVEELVRRGLSLLAPNGTDIDSTLPAALERFSACYQDNLFVRTRLYPGVAETLEALRLRGIRLCCLTNKRARFAEALLAEAGLLDRFELVLGGDSVAEKKPSPLMLDIAAERLGITPKVAVYIGDSHHDMHAAQAAGWPFVWATYGYRQIPAADLVAAFAIDSLPQLVERLDELVSPR